MWLRTAKKNSQKLVDRQEPHVHYLCTQATYCTCKRQRRHCQRSIEEFEYHVDCIRWMGYGKSFQDFKCNVHISVAKGPAGIKHAVDKRLSPARNTITIQNDENKWGLEHHWNSSTSCALVLYIHHHWCPEGEYIRPNTIDFPVIDSWRGVRSRDTLQLQQRRSTTQRFFT